jgi:hypothetical protein
MSFIQSILVGLLAFAPEIDAGPVSRNTVRKRESNPKDRRESEFNLVPSWSCSIDYDESGVPLPSWSCAAEENLEAGTPAVEWRCSAETAADGSSSWNCGSAKEIEWSCSAVKETIEARNTENKGIQEVNGGVIIPKSSGAVTSRSNSYDDTEDTDEEFDK